MPTAAHDNAIDWHAVRARLALVGQALELAPATIAGEDPVALLEHLFELKRQHPGIGVDWLVNRELDTLLRMAARDV